MFIGIFAGFPIAFTLIFLALIFGFIGIGQLVFHLMTLQFYSVMRDPILSAVPFFLFMGYILENSGLMDRLFKAFQHMLAKLSGSLYVAVIVTATIFAAATGIVGSSVTHLGVMAGPNMRESKYDVKLSAGAITAGGTLGILIPPSVMLVVMGPVVGVPVTDLFAAAFIPGFTLSALYIAYCLIRCMIDPTLGPPLPPEKRAPNVGYVVKELFVGVLPVSIVIMATLGTILLGVATPTEAAAAGSVGSLLLTLAYRRMDFPRFKDACFRTLEISSMILFLVAASNFFGAVFSRLGSATWLTEQLLALSLPPTLMLLLILGLIFVLVGRWSGCPSCSSSCHHPAHSVTKMGYNLFGSRSWGR